MAPTASGRRGLEHSTGAALAKVAAHLSTVEYRLNQPGGNELPRPPLENLDTERLQVELMVACATSTGCARKWNACTTCCGCED